MIKHFTLTVVGKLVITTLFIALFAINANAGDTPLPATIEVVIKNNLVISGTVFCHEEQAWKQVQPDVSGETSYGQTLHLKVPVDYGFFSAIVCMVNGNKSDPFSYSPGQITEFVMMYGGYLKPIYHW